MCRERERERERDSRAANKKTKGDNYDSKKIPKRERKNERKKERKKERVGELSTNTFEASVERELLWNETMSQGGIVTSSGVK